jgi:hypothetical protein
MSIEDVLEGDWSSACHDSLQEDFARMVQEAGFQDVEYENLVGGVVAIHSGFKLWNWKLEIISENTIQGDKFIIIHAWSKWWLNFFGSFV